MAEQDPVPVSDSNAEPQTDPVRTDLPATPSEPVSVDPETFPADYVRQLRDENAKGRLKAKRSDLLAERLVHALAAQEDRLIDASDLPVDDSLFDDDGMPDPEKIREAIDNLLRQKPHLARIRPRGNVGQGMHSAEEPAPVSLAALLRAGAG